MKTAMNLTLKIWRQKGPDEPGKMVTYEVADIPALDLTVDPPPTGANGWYKGGDTVGMVATAQAPASDPSTVGRVLVDVYALPTTSDATFATSPLTSHMIFSFQTSAETENGCEDSKSLDPAAIIAGLPDGRYGFFFTAARCDFGDPSLAPAAPSAAPSPTGRGPTWARRPWCA